MKQKVTITVWACRCERCGHPWQTKTRDTPLTCPKCKSPYWDKPKKRIEDDYPRFSRNKTR